MKLRVLVILCTALVYEPLALARERPLLGTAYHYKQLRKQNLCADLLTETSFATQLSFARDFLKYDADDIKTGLVNAIIAFFPRSEVLFSDPPVEQEKVNKNSISYRLRRSGHREADRTLTSIILLQKIILGEEPSAFSTPIAPLNPGVTEITRIRQIVFDFLTDQKGIPLDKSVFAKVKLEKLHALIVRLIIHDQGKFERFLSEYKARLQDDGIDISNLSADHDLALSDIQARFPFEMMPSVTTVLPEPRAQMEKSDIGAFNPGRVFQFEAPARHLLPLASLEAQPFQFSLIKEIFDVGGARGSEYPSGSFWIKPVIATYFRLYDDYSAGKIGANPQQIKNYYRDLLKAAGGELGLPVESDRDLAIVKLARLFRLNQFPQDARARRITSLLHAFQKLDQGIAARIINELSKSGIEDGWALTLGYIPQISENIQSALGVWVKKDADDEIKILDAEIDRAMSAALDVLFRAVQLARMSLKGKLIGNGEFTLELPQLGDFVKKNGVDALSTSEFVFRSAGRDSAEITIKSRTEFPTLSQHAPISELWRGITGIFGEGGGADAVTAAQILNTAILEQGYGSRFQVPVLVSVRTVKMGSAGRSGQEGSQRNLTSPGEILASGAMVVTPNSQMLDSDGKFAGRFFEANIARALKARGIPTDVVLIEHDGNVESLAAKYEAVRQRYKLNTIVGVDTGGDKFGTEKGNVHATVDQDQETFDATRLLFRRSNGALTHLIAVAGIGFDSPSFAPEIYSQGLQTHWNSSHPNWATLSQSLLNFWDEIGLNGNPIAVQQHAYYSRTQHALLLAVQGVRGLTTTALPVTNVTSDRNPWDPKVFIYPISASVITVDGAALETYQHDPK